MFSLSFLVSTPFVFNNHNRIMGISPHRQSNQRKPQHRHKKQGATIRYTLIYITI